MRIANDADVELLQKRLEHFQFCLRSFKGRIEASLIGKEVSIQRSQRKPSAYRFMVGDSSLVDVL